MPVTVKKLAGSPINPHAVFLLTYDGKLDYSEKSVSAMTAKCLWNAAAVGRTPVTFTKFLIDAKAKGASDDSLRAVVGYCDMIRHEPKIMGILGLSA